jgi:hypothetical protein
LTHQSIFLLSIIVLDSDILVEKPCSLSRHSFATSNSPEERLFCSSITRQSPRCNIITSLLSQQTYEDPFHRYEWILVNSQGTKKTCKTMDVASSHSTVLDLPPSAVAFCPSHPEYYVVGTYFLHPTAVGEEPSDAPQKRTGTLVLYRLEGTQL